MVDVGIVMPVYKQKSSYLRLALRSILKQTYARFRLVIVIDGATQNVLRVVDKETRSDNRVHVIVSIKNKGVAEALNKGFQVLNADNNIEYLTWVSSDNVYYRHFISTLREALINNPSNVGFVYSTFRHINARGKSIYSKRFMRSFLNFQNQPKENLLDLCFVGVSFMYRKLVAAKIGGYGREPVEDYDYWLRLTEHCDIAYTPRQLMDYRVSSPYSISAKLKSPEAHRHWRFAFQSAKNEARRRRKIPFETTVIFTVKEASEGCVQQMELMLEQYYSNYKFIIVDYTPGGGAIKQLQSIPDPRVTFIHAPSADTNKAVKIGLRKANTPFTLLYRNSGNMGALQELVQQIRGVNKKVDTVYWTPNGTIAHERLSENNELIFQRLYRTQPLKRFVKKL
jgi:GT2 family glycosyltransferase